MKDEEGDDEMDLDGDYTPANGIDVDMSNGGASGGVSTKAAGKRKATGTPSVSLSFLPSKLSCPDCKLTPYPP